MSRRDIRIQGTGRMTLIASLIVAFWPVVAGLAAGQSTPATNALRIKLLYPGTETSAEGLDFQPSERWLAFDKAQHFAFSFLWTLGVQYTLVDKADWSNRRALPISLGSGAALGVAKEIYDGTWGPHRHFSKRDLVADAAGLLLAGGFILL